MRDGPSHAARRDLRIIRRATRPPLTAAPLALSLIALTTPVMAQRVGWAVDRVEPSPAGDLFFQTHFPSYAADRPATLSFNLVNAYSYRPLLATVANGRTTETVDAIEHLFATHAQINLQIAQRLGVDLSMPIYWLQSGSQDPALPVRAASGVSAGEIRLGVRLRIVGHADRDPASLHLAATGRFGFLPTASANANTDGSLRARVFAVGAGAAGPFRWSLSAGIHARSGFDTAAVHIGSELFALAGAGLSLASGRFFVGLEGEFAAALDTPFQAGTNHAQAWGMVRTALLDGALQIALGAGPGFSQAPGTPTFGGFFTLGYTLPVGATNGSQHRVAGTRSTTNTLVSTAPALSSASPGEPGTGSATAPTSGTGAPQTTAPGADSSGVELSRIEATHSNSPSSTVGGETGFCDVPSEEHCSTGDQDSDGVREPLDVCPTTPAGAHSDPTRAGCPDVDTDSDGVFDHADACPAAAEGTAPDPERRGCPLPDADGDRIPDAVDHCPAVPGAPHPDPTLNGCPGLVRLDANSVEILAPIFFAPNRDRIQPRSTPVMQAIANALAARTDIRHMLIEGHTDDAGNDEMNVDLSQRRAAAVLRWLVDHGISPSRLQCRGLGSHAPRVTIVPGMRRRALRDARTRNRRVEFEIVDTGSVASSSSAPPPSRAP